MPDQLTIPGIGGADDLSIRTSGLSRAWFAVVTLLAALASGVGTFVAILPAGPVNDDITNLDFVASADRVTDTFLTPVFFTQLSPGHRLLTALQLEVGALDRVVVHGLVAGMVGLSVVLGSLVMRRLYGRQPWVPVVLALALSGPAAIRTNLWYAAAFHTTPSLVLGIAALLAHMRYRDDRARRGWLALSVLCVTLGLAFSIRVMLAVLVMALVEQVLLRQRDVATTLRETWDRRGTWTWYVLPLAVYWYLERRFGSAPSPGDLGIVLEAVLRGYVEVFGPLLVGYARRGDQTAGAVTPGWLVAVSHAVIVTVASLSVLRRRDAVRGLGAAAVVVLVGLGISTAARSVPFGVDASLALRYHAEPLVYAVLLLPWGFRGVATGAHLPSVRLLRGGFGIAVTSLALAGVSATTVWSARQQLVSDPGPASARWLEAVEDAQDELAGPVGVLEVPIATPVMEAFPGRRFDVVEFLYPNLDVTATLPAVVVTDTGELRPVEPIELYRQDGAELLENTLVVTTGEFEAADTSLCTASSMQLEVVLAPHPLPRFLEVTTGTGANLRLAFVSGDGGSGAIEAEVRAIPLDGPAVLPLDLLGTTAVARLRVEAVDGKPACVDQLAIFALDVQLPATPLGPGLAGTRGD